MHEWSTGAMTSAHLNGWKGSDKIPILQSGHNTDSHSEAEMCGEHGHSHNCTVFNVGRGNKE